MTRTVYRNAVTSPHKIEIGSDWSQKLLWLIVSKKKFFLKGGFWGRNTSKFFFMTIFVIDSMRQCFLIKSCQILLEVKVKVTDISGSKSNHFLKIFINYQLFRFCVNTRQNVLLSFRSAQPKAVHLHTILKIRGGELASEFLWIIFSKIFFFFFKKSKGFLRKEYINSFYDKFCHWLQKGVFSIQDWSNLVRKCLKMKVRLVILLTPKSIISYFKLFHFGVKISEKFLLLVTSEVSHYAI